MLELDEFGRGPVMTGALPLPPDVSDGSLARSAAAGDRQAFAYIYDRYADRLYDFCRGLLGDRDAAADCVHDAFCVAATELGELREPEKLRPWLYSIVRNHAMRHLRGRYREEVSEYVPDSASNEFGPETLAGQSELARLVADAAGGLSDRDRELLELSYRHGLDGPEIAETLGVSLTNANTMVFRLRQTVERCLGALLLARGARVDADACPELVAILKGWDGSFTVLMRKRVARHIESCGSCTEEQHRRVNPVALLGGAPVFLPAPDWLRTSTLNQVQLTSCSAGIEPTVAPSRPKRIGAQVALLAGVPLLILGATVLWITPRHAPIAPAVDTGTISHPSTKPAPPPTGASNKPPVVTRSAPPPAVSVPPPIPTHSATATTPAPAPKVTTPEVTTPKVTTPEVTTPEVTTPNVTPPGPPVLPFPPKPKPAPPVPPNPTPPDPPVTPPWNPNPNGTGQNPYVTPPWTPPITLVVPTFEISPPPCTDIAKGCPKASG